MPVFHKEHISDEERESPAFLTYPLDIWILNSSEEVVPNNYRFDCIKNRYGCV
jgi:hypothetical protein